MAIKKYQDSQQDTPNSEDASSEELPTMEEIENLEQKIQANTDELANISNALVQSMLVSVIMSAHCPPNSEILHNLNVSNEAIVACVDEAAQIAALLNYIKEELKNYKE
ncbi:hypothetical protein KR032_001014 [Drosophila birchii]|nr:hypothetical protein KR032_001014 [Drosophila birchii]